MGGKSSHRQNNNVVPGILKILIPIATRKNYQSPRLVQRNFEQTITNPVGISMVALKCSQSVLWYVFPTLTWIDWRCCGLLAGQKWHRHKYPTPHGKSHVGGALHIRQGSQFGHTTGRQVHLEIIPQHDFRPDCKQPAMVALLFWIDGWMVTKSKFWWILFVQSKFGWISSWRYVETIFFSILQTPMLPNTG